MEKLLTHIIERLREQTLIDQVDLDKMLRERSAQLHTANRLSKKQLLPYYLTTKQENPILWQSWNVTDEIEKQLVRLLRVKPRRSASGVATITVITKPWMCKGTCIYCPNDIRMPKSYLHNEPACQRAERCWFDPYLQIDSRLSVLEAMGHVTDKVEVIVLGGTWLDYSHTYRRWFVTELFAALNDSPEKRTRKRLERRAHYSTCGFPETPEQIQKATEDVQRDINKGNVSYNEALTLIETEGFPWRALEAGQIHTWEQMECEQKKNEFAEHRMVGLVFETRPETITEDALYEMRRMGCTKVQVGIQSTDDLLLKRSKRCALSDTVRSALSLLRLFGFKIHVHLMANLPGATPKSDRDDFYRLITDLGMQPDEAKLYPCSLVDGTALMSEWQQGHWQPYTEDQLVSLLAEETKLAPPYLRISRMIRDISADDIVVGNKKANLRQLVEQRLCEDNAYINEIRYREIAKGEVKMDTLTLDDYIYTTDVSREHFLQWIDGHNRIYGFLRLSLPSSNEILQPYVPRKAKAAMIREVHVYGFAESLDASGTSAQHRGLGKRLIKRACTIAKDAGYHDINVISAVGTRNYYRKLGFSDGVLYQYKEL